MIVSHPGYLFDMNYEIKNYSENIKSYLTAIKFKIKKKNSPSINGKRYHILIFYSVIIIILSTQYSSNVFVLKR